jgi:hypothetical protein
MLLHAENDAIAHSTCTDSKQRVIAKLPGVLMRAGYCTYFDAIKIIYPIYAKCATVQPAPERIRLEEKRLNLLVGSNSLQSRV